MVTLWQQQDGGYMLLWKRYVNNKMAAMRFLHLQQYSHRLNLLFFFLSGATAPQWARASSFTRFLDHTQRRTTVGRDPLDERSARRRDLYLTTHNTHNRQTSMPPVAFEPTISAGERPQPYALDRAATGTGIQLHVLYIILCLFKIWHLHCKYLIYIVFKWNICSHRPWEKMKFPLNRILCLSIFWERSRVSSVCSVNWMAKGPPMSLGNFIFARSFTAGSESYTISYPVTILEPCTFNKSDRIVRLTTHYCLMSRLRTRGALILLILSWSIDAKFTLE